MIFDLSLCNLLKITKLSIKHFIKCQLLLAANHPTENYTLLTFQLKVTFLTWTIYIGLFLLYTSHIYGRFWKWRVFIGHSQIQVSSFYGIKSKLLAYSEPQLQQDSFFFFWGGVSFSPNVMWSVKTCHIFSSCHHMKVWIILFSEHFTGTFYDSRNWYQKLPMFKGYQK